MRKLLRIGEIAQLLGVTTKTIRHYHKIGLLQEPERTDAGYRLYSAQDLLRLKQIRHLQSFGIPLRRMKSLLGEQGQEHSLREILQGLDQEIAGQIQVLEQRREGIRELLCADNINVLEQTTSPETVEWVRGLLDAHALHLSPAALELEERLWEAIRGFHWPQELNERIARIVQQMVAQTTIAERLVRFQECVTTLATTPEDAPEVMQLVDELIDDVELWRFLQDVMVLTKEMPALASPFVDTLGDLMSSNMSSAQLRFFTELARRGPFKIKDTLA